jgi:hypothetical protein
MDVVTELGPLSVTVENIIARAATLTNSLSNTTPGALYLLVVRRSTPSWSESAPLPLV